MGDFFAELHCVFYDVYDVHFHFHGLDEKDAKKFKDNAEVMFSKIKKAVQSLHAAADKLDKAWSDCKVTCASGTSVGILGGVMTIIGGVATVMTAGAATPPIQLSSTGIDPMRENFINSSFCCSSLTYS